MALRIPGTEPKEPMTAIDWQRFHDDLRAALLAKVPMRDEQGSFLKNSKLDEYIGKLTTTSGQGLSPDELRTRLLSSDSLPKWFVAASEIFTRTGSTVPVLEGVSASDQASNDANHAMRWTFIYLLLVLATALAGLVFFYLAGADSMESFRHDLTLPPAPAKQHSFDGLKFLPWIIVGLSILLGVALIGLLAIGTKRFSMLFGGKRFVGYALSSIVLRIAQTISRSGSSQNESISLACDLVGANDSVRNDVDALLRGTNDDKTIQKMANCQRQTAHQCLVRMKVTTPMLLITLVGGSVTIIYCLIMFLPIVSMLKDMANQAGL